MVFNTVRVLMCGTSLLAIGVTGCTQAEQIGSGVKAAFVGEDLGPDACASHFKTLEQAGGAFQSDVVGKALLGAVAGAVIGGIVSGGDGGTILAGAALGGLTAGSAAYLQNKQKQAKTREQLLQSVHSDMSTFDRDLDTTQIAFDRLVTCRKGEVATVRARFKTGSISRAQAEAELDRLSKQYRRDVKLGKEVNAEVQKRSKVFAGSTVSLNPNTNPNKLRGLEKASRAEQAPTTQIDATRYAVLKNANVRGGPSTDHAKIGGVVAGNLVLVVGERKGWLQVKLPNGREGWVADFLLAAPGTSKYVAATTKPVQLAKPELTTIVASSEVERPEDLVPLAQSVTFKSDSFDRTLANAEIEASHGFEVSDTGFQSS